MTGLQLTYEMQIQRMMVQALQCACDGVEKKEESRHAAQVSADDGLTGELQSVLFLRVNSSASDGKEMGRST
jgi:hypothetical protein